MAKKRQTRKKAYSTETAQDRPVTRRGAMSYLQWGILGAVLVGGVGGYAVTSVMADIEEQDLSVIGNGTPAVVQIHDPACGDCVVLEREARAALRNFDEGDFSYRIASLVSEDGLAYARQHSVGRVTLMLIDGDGRTVDIMTGPRSREQLRIRLASFLETGR